MSEFNKDELEAPSWLNRNYFEEILRTSENDNSISITDMKISAGSGKEDHYSSIMFRAEITYDTGKSKANSKSLIIKTVPDLDGHRNEFLGRSYTFETEISIYSKTIPKFEAELRKVGDETVLGAKCLHYSLEPRKVIIFEDLVPKGYATLRKRSPCMEEVKGALLKLAKWHAVSYKLAAEGDTSVTDYREGFLNMKDVETMPFLVSGMENLIAKADTIAELKQYVPKLRSIQKDLIKRCIVTCNTYRQQGAQGVFVLNHGDFHAKNMMFKSSDKCDHEDVMLVDFQLCHFGPAIVDVMYVVYTICNRDLRTNHREELVYYYCSVFNDTLKGLKFEGVYPQVADFYIDFIRHKHFELLLMSTFLPVWYAFFDGNLDMDELMTSDEKRKSLFDNEELIEELKRLLPSMLYRGYLEDQ